MDSVVSPAELGTGGSLAKEVMVQTCHGCGGVTEGTTVVERDAEVGEPGRSALFGVANRMASYHLSPFDCVESYIQGDHESCRVSVRQELVPESPGSQGCGGSNVHLSNAYPFVTSRRFV